MRPFLAPVTAVAALLLGIVQVFGSIAVRADAQWGAWPRAVPAGFAARVDGLDTGLPLPPALRLVLARHAVERGDLVLAARNIARLPPSRDRFALEGDLAERRGDIDAAVAAYLAAGDIAALENAVASFSAHGEYPRALRLQQAAVARLQSDRTQADALAEAEFALGRLLQDAVYQSPPDAPDRLPQERAAAAAYERAVALAPLSLRYLIGLANQELNLARVADAERTFARAHEVDPTSAEPLAGLADAALRRNDRAAARAYLERARTLDPGSAAVERVARRL